MSPYPHNSQITVNPILSSLSILTSIPTPNLHLVILILPGWVQLIPLHKPFKWQEPPLTSITPLLLYPQAQPQMNVFHNPLTLKLIPNHSLTIQQLT